MRKNMTECASPEILAARNRLAEEIRERRKAARELLYLRGSLEQRVRERTADLETFCYSLSHDFTSALRRITIFSEVLAGEYGRELGGAGLDYARRIHGTALETSSLMEGLLQFCSADVSGLNIEDLDMSSLAAGEAAALRAGEPARRVELAVVGGLRARGDRRLIRLVLRNLLCNAWKFTSRREAARIEFGRSGGEFFVRDNGIGFDGARNEAVFPPSGSRRSAAGFSGSGLGLAIVRRILLRHGGGIRAESGPGGGAAFYFFLPGAPATPGSAAGRAGSAKARRRAGEGAR